MFVDVSHVNRLARSNLLACRAPVVAIYDDPPMRQLDLFCLRSSGRGGRRPGINPAQFSQQNFVVGLVINVVDVNITNNAILVDDEQRPLGMSFFGTQNPILRGNSAVWPKVAQERIADAPQAFRPSGQTGDVIYADAQNLGIRFRELGLIGLVSRNLVRSDRGPGQRKERQNDVVAAQLTQLHLFTKMAGKCKIGGLLPHFQAH